MNFSSLSANDKLLVYGAVAAVIGGLVGSIGGLIFLSVLAAIAMLIVVFLPQFSPQTSLPGSRGSLVMVIGLVAAIAAALAFLTIVADIGFWFDNNPVRAVFFLIAVAGSLLMGWIGWQEFQAEGGKLQLGTTNTAGTGTATQAPPPPAADTSAPPPRTEPVAPPAPAEPPATAEPTSTAPPPATSETDDRPMGAERDDTGDNRVG